MKNSKKTKNILSSNNELYSYFQSLIPNALIYINKPNKFIPIAIDKNCDNKKILEYLDILYLQKVITQSLLIGSYEIIFDEFIKKYKKLYNFDKTNIHPLLIEKLTSIYNELEENLKKNIGENEMNSISFDIFAEKHYEIFCLFIQKNNITLEKNMLYEVLYIILKKKEENKNNIIKYLLDKNDLSKIEDCYEIQLDILDLFVSEKNQDCVEYFFSLYPSLIQYDDSFENLSQNKGFDYTFLDNLFEKISKNYDLLPNFVDDENSINYMIHMKDEKRALKYLKMIQIQNYSNYINHAIESKMFELLDYLLYSISQIDNSYFTSNHFKKRVSYTTLLYNENDEIELNKIFQKYNIQINKIIYPFINAKYCNICLEESEEETKHLFCFHCKNTFHSHCLLQYIDSKKK